MQILRFDDEGVKAPNRKKSSRSLLILGLVGALFGISSAFASSTIAINSGTAIALGQGVTTVAACDNEIEIAASTEMVVETTTPTFYLASLVISKVNSYVTNTDAVGCGGKTFELQIFDGSNRAYSCDQLKATDAEVKYLDDPTSSPQRVSCGTDSKLSFAVLTNSKIDSSYKVTFKKAPSDISYITLVSRES